MWSQMLDSMKSDLNEFVSTVATDTTEAIDKVKIESVNGLPNVLEGASQSWAASSGVSTPKEQPKAYKSPGRAAGSGSVSAAGSRSVSVSRSGWGKSSSSKTKRWVALWSCQVWCGSSGRGPVVLCFTADLHGATWKAMTKFCPPGTMIVGKSRSSRSRSLRRLNPCRMWTKSLVPFCFACVFFTSLCIMLTTLAPCCLDVYSIFNGSQGCISKEGAKVPAFGTGLIWGERGFE